MPIIIEDKTFLEGEGISPMDYYRELTSHEAFSSKLDRDAKICEAAMREREMMERFSSGGNEDEYKQDEPLVERDFEG